MQEVNFETVCKADVEETLLNHYGFDKASSEQFWKLEGEAYLEEAYQAMTEILSRRASSYEKLLGRTAK